MQMEAESGGQRIWRGRENMAVWFQNMIREIREHTERMDRKQKLEYILTYYWYHLLFVVVSAGLLILLVRHLFFREPPKAFTCVLVNQTVDYARDEELAADFAAVSGIDPERIEIDSDYIFSYGDVKLEAANESSYEKFFFRWGEDELDAVLMPESFYRHCRELEYEFADLGSLCTEEQKRVYAGSFLEEGGRQEALYVEDTRLKPYVRQTEGDRMILVYVPESGHVEADRAFLAFVMGM